MPGPDSQGRRDAAVVIAILLVLGVLGGVLWSQAVTPAEFTKLAKGGAMGEDQLSHQFGAVGWYVVIAAALALVAGAVLCWWRSANVVMTSAALLAGSVLAAVAMALTGHLLGPDDPETALAAAKVGARVPDSLKLGMRPVWPLPAYLKDTVAIYLVWPVAVLAGALIVLVGRARDDDRPPQGSPSGADDPLSSDVGNPDNSDRSSR